MSGPIAPKAILVFDGDCSFCTSAANFSVRKSSTPLTAIPWQFSELASLGLTADEASRKVQLVTDGKIFAGHKCFAKLLRLQSNPIYKTIGWLIICPPINLLSAAGYALVAKFRHKLPGGTPACKLPQG
ncbi:MAG: thiol-disulfide oxidoreductase DCC family protein [Rhodoluna sp.]